MSTEAARVCYRGELLPGFYDDWVQEERRRLTAINEQIAPLSDGIALTLAQAVRLVLSEPTG